MHVTNLNSTDLLKRGPESLTEAHIVFCLMVVFIFHSYYQLADPHVKDLTLQNIILIIDG